MRFPTTIFPAALALLPLCPAQAQDLVVPAGTTVQFDSALGLAVDSVLIEQGATVRVFGSAPLRILATDQIRIDGTLDLSGYDAPGVVQLQGATAPSAGGAGAAGGGFGGVGSSATNSATLTGLPGSALASTYPRGGEGGESSFAPGSNDNQRRGAGGGGGRLAQDALAQGLMATAGKQGSPSAQGAMSFINAAAGGQPGPSPFSGSTDDDFFGIGLDAATGQLVHGELSQPAPGRGGGAGGDSIESSIIPPLPWTPSKDAVGGGGGGGGGLGLLSTARLIVGPSGRILANGGDGAMGETASVSNPIGGSGGGGSGGMLLIQAREFDLSMAGPDAISAIGGKGGAGIGDLVAGGDGGPGLIQFHVEGDPATAILLPVGLGLADLTAPDAHVLLPFAGL
ncbi:hypothetical protein [Engelhardtia mirabilis]|uniref:Uncharacterized protein n=1 Tax=Engelhardtia mirabilis TaxID=2528011 RepID=A0A518BFH8_9BACT|nr:hypothetical protein Pla133_07820 [Planctomycetes bacterium Pla133]QDV00042.1 hypothetical protein Pla86_07810 [Planctomycetes bacterium Pla86]